jgi:hypothetical protein
MGKRTVALNQKDVSLRIRVLDDATGIPYEGMTDVTAGHRIWYQRGYDIAAVTDGGSANDHAGVGDAHTDWEFIHLIAGDYRVDFPDAAFLEDVGTVLCGMDATGYSCIAETVTISPFLKFQGEADSVTATTTTFESGTTPLKGDVIMVMEGTGDNGNQVLVTSVAGEVATHAAFSTGISATTTTIVLISGDEITAQGGINCDAQVSLTATPAQVAAAADQAIVDASLATADKLLGFTQLGLRKDSAIETDRATEVSEINADEGSGAGVFDNTTDSQEGIISDTDNIQARLPAALSTDGNMKSNIKEVNDVEVTGDGETGTEWNPI